MTTGEGDPGQSRFEEEGATGPAGPPAPGGGFGSELAAAFRRHRPQNSARWNFSVAFTRLEERYGPRPPASGLRSGDGEAGPGREGGAGAEGSAGREPVRSLLHRLADRYVTGRLQPWVAEQAEATASRVTDEALVRERRSTADGFDATVEALRFLGARVEQLEDAAGRRNAPVDAVAALVVPPPAEWTGPVVDWLLAARPPGVVLHGECGEGELVEALAGAGIEARGVEPRGDAAWRAADGGARVEVGEVPDLLRSQPAGSLGGLVLSGVVDRAPIDDLVALVEVSAARLNGGAPLVVVGTRPEAAAGWDAVARDLLPGRPLHPETWELLLARAGFVDVGRLDTGPAGGDVATYAVRAHRPS